MRKTHASVQNFPEIDYKANPIASPLYTQNFYAKMRATIRDHKIKLYLEESVIAILDVHQKQKDFLTISQP